MDRRADASEPVGRRCPAHAGLLVLVTLLFVNQVLFRTPVVTDLTTWYAGVTVAGVLLLLGFATYGFVTSRAGEPVFGKQVI